jgi:hypothetical protein
MAGPIAITIGSQTRSAWIPLDTTLTPFSVGIGCVCSSNKNLTYSVEYAHDTPLEPVPCRISAAGTTATLVLTNHGLSTADSIIVIGSNFENFNGTYQVAGVTDQNTITYTIASTTGATVSSKVCPMRVFVHPTIVSKTDDSDGNFAYPVQAMRLNVSAWVAGYVTMLITQAGL